MKTKRKLFLKRQKQKRKDKINKLKCEINFLNHELAHNV